MSQICDSVGARRLESGTVKVKPSGLVASSRGRSQAVFFALKAVDYHGQFVLNLETESVVDF